MKSHPARNQALVALLATGTLWATPALAAPIAFETEVMASNPMAYWRLNDTAATAADRTGQGHDGTYSATGVTRGQPGLFGGDASARFDGVIGGISVPFSDDFNVTNVSIEALVSWSGPNGFYQRILERSFFLGGEQAEYGMGILADGRVQFEIRAGGGPSFQTSALAIAAGVATHLAATYDGHMMRIFMDGGLVSEQLPTWAGDIQANPVSGLGVGNQFERNRPFNGVIDEVALYGFALSADQIAAHFGALSAVPEPGSIVLMGSGGVLVLLRSAFRRRRRQR